MWGKSLEDKEENVRHFTLKNIEGSFRKKMEIPGKESEEAAR
jgi:hypothetical protein